MDFEGNTITNDLFAHYDATIVNFWSNGCGSCIEEMPELEDYYQRFKDQRIHLLGVAISAGESDALRTTAETILKEKGVTYPNIIPDITSPFYKDFIRQIAGYPTTYVVDSKGNMIGAPIFGVVKSQEDTLMKRLEMIHP
ncbi:MAG: TlpA disulfide reductase family protein [Clostridia bacterium]